jgi:predicted DNA-binding transcriptional regulator YafY
MKRPRIKRSSFNRRRDKPAGITEKVINILKILNLIEQGKAPSVRILSEVCEVSERSIYRYLNILYSIVPIFYDSKLGGYRFENERALKVIPFEKKEIALLSSLMDLISKSGKDIQKTFKGIIEKIYICQDKEHAYTHQERFFILSLHLQEIRDGLKR